MPFCRCRPNATAKARRREDTLSEASQEREERAFVVRTQRQPERVARNGAFGHTWPLPTARFVVRQESAGIEQLFEAAQRPVVKQERSIPDPAQRRNLVEAS